MSRIDIGHGVSIEPRYVDGELCGIAYWHPRPDDGTFCEGWIGVQPFWSDGWRIASEEPLTVWPSLRCRACGHHGWIRNGRWEPT